MDKLKNGWKRFINWVDETDRKLIDSPVWYYFIGWTEIVFGIALLCIFLTYDDSLYSYMMSSSFENATTLNFTIAIGFFSIMYPVLDGMDQLSVGRYIQFKQRKEREELKGNTNETEIS